MVQIMKFLIVKPSILPFPSRLGPYSCQDPALKYSKPGFLF